MTAQPNVLDELRALVTGPDAGFLADVAGALDAVFGEDSGMSPGDQRIAVETMIECAILYGRRSVALREREAKKEPSAEPHE